MKHVFCKLSVNQRIKSLLLLFFGFIVEIYHYWLKEHYENVRYFFVEDHDRVFHRTHYLNRLIRMSETCIVGVWDTDVFVPEKQKTEAAQVSATK